MARKKRSTFSKRDNKTLRHYQDTVRVGPMQMLMHNPPNMGTGAGAKRAVERLRLLTNVQRGH